MTEEINQNYPKTYQQINSATKASGFDMASDVLTCSLLKTLAATKPSGKFLELGTGTGYRPHGYWMVWMSTVL